MSNRYKMLNLKREILTLRYTLLTQLINSLRLASDRAEDAVEFVESELQKAKSWLNKKSKPVKVKFYYYMPVAVKDLDDNNIFGSEEDHINFGPQKADWVVKDDESFDWISKNSVGSIKRWNDAKNSFQIQIKAFKKFAKELLSIIRELDEEIKNNLLEFGDYNSDVKSPIVAKSSDNSQKIANNYLLACKELNSDDPSVYKLAKHYNNNPSKSSWDRYLRDVLILGMITKEVQKKINNKKIKRENKDFWLKVYLNINDKVDKIRNKNYQSKTTTLDENIQYADDKFEQISQDYNIKV